MPVGEGQVKTVAHDGGGGDGSSRDGGPGPGRTAVLVEG